MMGSRRWRRKRLKRLQMPANARQIEESVNRTQDVVRSRPLKAFQEVLC